MPLREWQEVEEMSRAAGVDFLRTRYVAYRPVDSASNFIRTSRFLSPQPRCRRST
jgi:hypothetical protein